MRPSRKARASVIGTFRDRGFFAPATKGLPLSMMKPIAALEWWETTPLEGQSMNMKAHTTWSTS